MKFFFKGDGGGRGNVSDSRRGGRNVTQRKLNPKDQTISAGQLLFKNRRG